MNRRLALLVAASLLVVASVSANSGPPSLPKGHRRVDPPVQFEGIEKYPEYIFHVQCDGSYIGSRWFRVKDSKAFTLEFPDFRGRAPNIQHMVLLGLTHKEFEKRAKNQTKLDWLTEETDGVLWARVAAPSLSVPISQKEIPVTTYRVTLTEGKLRAEKVEDKKSSEGPSASLLPTWAFGLVSSLSIAWLGIWFVRRGSSAVKPGN